MPGCALGALYADLLCFLTYWLRGLRTGCVQPLGLSAIIELGQLDHNWKFFRLQITHSNCVLQKTADVFKKCLLLNYSLVSIFKRGKKRKGKKGLSQNQCTDGQVHFPFGISRLKLVTITLVSFPRSSHLQPMCKTPYTTWATLIRQWQQHHTTVKQWHTNQPKKGPLTHTHTHHRSNGKGGRWWRTQRNHGTQERLRQKKKRKITDSKLVTSVFISLFKEHMPLPSSAMGERNRRWDYECDALPAHPLSVLPKYSTRPKKEHSREP